jgi:acyl-CoA synthetase (AMP-forming)/AMP-acid ligase II
MNVYPREIELALEALPQVREAAVVGRPSERWGEEVVAFVVSDERLDPDALTAAMAEQLAPHKRPKLYLQRDELPRNHMGKIVKADLAAVAIDIDAG